MLVVFALAVSALSRAQEVPLGVVQQASHASLKQRPVSDGATVFSGEELSTDVGGVLAVSVGGTGVRLLESSRAFIYRGASGPIAELIQGTLVFRKEASGQSLTVVASDVRIVSRGDGPVTAQVLLVSPCEIRVSTVAGQLDVTSGKETKTIVEKETYSVVPHDSVIPVRAVRAGVSPDQPGYHQSHSHKVCEERRNKNWAGTPKSPSTSSFLKLAGAGAIIATIVLILRSEESPSHP
jgi:hypothetical protein